MATGDILSCEVLATGWQAKVVVEGLSTGGTYDFGDIDTDVANATFAMTVVSEGYSTAGVLGTKTRTVYGTRVVQKAYPNHATAEETASVGNVELTIALSDYVYDDDKNGGAGTSGTDPTVTIGAGWYTQGGTPTNAATALSVTNSSTQDYPTVIARWAVVPYQRFTGTFDLEAVAFHRFAEHGKPVACVTFEATDGTNTETITSTAMVQSAAADSLPCYQATLTASAYTDNAVVTANVTAYPWVGDADSLRTSVGGTANALTLGPLPLYADSDDDFPVYHAVVTTSGGSDTTGVASTTFATADASRCATIRGAMNKIATAAGGNVGGAYIYLVNNNHSWGDGTDITQTSTNIWLTVTRHPSTAKADACITGAPNAGVKTNLMRLYDLTLKPTGFIGFGNAAGRTMWNDAVDTVCASQVTSESWRLFDLAYYTHCTADKLDRPFASNSTNSIPALVRGCSATNAKSLGITDFGPRCVLTTTFDHANSLAGLFVELSTTNTIVAYCRDLANPQNGAVQAGVTSSMPGDCAFVCNVFEDTAGASNTFSVYDSGTTAADNVILWHNTVAGERTNVAYQTSNSVARRNFSIKYNSFEYFATKHDVVATNGSYIGGWSVLYGVGCPGNNSARNTDDFKPNYFGIRSTLKTAEGYVDDKSLKTAGTGNGDYTPDAGSVLLDKIATAADVVIPWDINGVAYDAGGCAGAITIAAALTTYRPSADISAGSWTPSSGSNLYAMVNDAGDSTYIRSSTGAASDTCEVDFPAMATPPAGTVTVYVRHRATP